MSGALARIGRLVQVEALKVVGGRNLRVGLLAVAAVTAFTAWTHVRVSEETPWTLVAAALSAGLWAAEIFLLVAGTTTIAGETAQGTLKMILPHAYRRSDWIVAKGLVLAAQALLLLLTATLVAWIAGTIAGGLGDVTQSIDASFGGEGRVEVLQTRAEMAGHLLDTLLVSGAALVATALLGLFLSCLFDGVVPALSTGFLLFLGIKSAGTLFGASPELLAKVYATYPTEMLTRVEKLGRGFAERWNSDLYGKGLVLSAMVVAGSVLLSLVVFSRRDLQS